MEEISKLEFGDPPLLPPSRPRAPPRPVERWIKNQTISDQKPANRVCLGEEKNEEASEEPTA